MNKLTKKFSILLASVAMATGVGLVGGAKTAKADSTYSISFKTGATSDGNKEIAASDILSNSSLIEANTLAKSVNAASKVYTGKSGAKLGSSKAIGSIKFTLLDDATTNIKSITVVTAKYGTDPGKLKVTADSTVLTSTATPGTDYTYTYYVAGSATTLQIETTAKRMYLVSVTVVCGDTISETADAFISAVNAIPSVDSLTLTDKTSVEKARNEYEKLTQTLQTQDDVKAALTTLEAAEAKMAELEAAAAEEEDVKAATAVDELVNALGEVDLTKASQVKAARDAYNALSENAKTKVTTLTTLEAAEATIDTLKAAEVDTLINAIGEVTDYSKAEQIKAARDAYEALNANAKTKVTALETLVAAETALAEYAPLVSEFAASDLGVADKADLTTYTVNRITYTFDKATGTNAPLYYVNGKNARCYTNNQLIIQGGTDVGAITSITLTAASTWGGVTVSPASEISGSSPYVITVGSATNTVVITFSGKSFITNVSVAYTKATTEQVAANEFIAKWNVYSADYCTNMADETKRAEILALIAEYEALAANVKAIVDANIDLTGTEMAKTIEYAKNYINFLNGTATGEGSTGTVLSAVTESGASTIAIVAALVLLTFVGYVVISKKKLVK